MIGAGPGLPRARPAHVGPVRRCARLSPPVTTPRSAQTALTGATTDDAWACPALAAAGRRAGSSTFLPIARRAALSGVTTATRTPWSVSLRTWRARLSTTPKPRDSGAITTTRSHPAARSALVPERIPPSTYRRPLIVTGGQIPGTAQLAPTASTRLTPLDASNTVNSPLTASTAVT